MSEYDVVVVGGGAAGLSAALVLSRARRNVAVVDAGEPRNAPAAHMHGYLSRDGFPPKDLLAIGRQEVQTYGGRLFEGRITGVVAQTTPQGEPTFKLIKSDGAKLRARRVLVATGLRDVIPDIEGAAERWGRDLLHCPYCHGYEARDQALAVIGGSDEAVQHALLIRHWASDVVLLTHHEQRVTAESDRLLAARGVSVLPGRIRRLVVEDDHLAAVELVDGHHVPVGAVFVRPRFVPNDAVLSIMDCERDDAGWVVTDRVGRTSVAGLWAAGNVVDPRAQVITAAGQGSAAAIALNASLIEEDISRTVAARD
jgi:thioredoxin reductase